MRIFCFVCISYTMLKFDNNHIYKVKEGQRLKEIAEAFCVSEYLLAKENGLTQEPLAGRILYIPKERGNAYTVKAGDTKKLLCGSNEAFLRKNGTEIFYIGMRIIL